MPVAGERLAFYRILFRHQDRFRPGEVDLARAEPVVVGKRMRDELETERAQVPEEALRVADAGERMHAAPAERLGGHAAAAVRHAMELESLERQAKAGRGARQRVEARRNRLAVHQNRADGFEAAMVLPAA